MYITPPLSPSILEIWTKTYESKGVFVKTMVRQHPIWTHSPAFSVKMGAKSAVSRCSYYCVKGKQCLFLAFTLIKSSVAWVFSLCFSSGAETTGSHLTCLVLFTKGSGGHVCLIVLGERTRSADRGNHFGCFRQRSLCSLARVFFRLLLLHVV